MELMNSLPSLNKHVNKYQVWTWSTFSQMQILKRKQFELTEPVAQLEAQLMIK